MDEAPDRPPTSTLDRIFAELKDIVNAQTARSESIEEKASQILRFDALVVGLILTASSLGPARTAPDGAHPVSGVLFAGVGLVAVLASAVLAIMAYRSRAHGVGMGTRALAGAAASARDDADFLATAVQTYVLVFQRNAHALDAKTSRIDAALWPLVAALAALALASAALLAAR